MPALPHSARTLFCLLALLFSFSGGEMRAQHALPVSVGSRVRVTAPEAISYKVIGQLKAVSTVSLVLAEQGRGNLFSVPLASVSTLEVSQGRRGDLETGAWLGAGAGLLGGFALGVLCVKLCSTSAGSGANIAPIGGMFVAVPVGALGGAIVWTG